MNVVIWTTYRCILTAYGNRGGPPGHRGKKTRRKRGEVLSSADRIFCGGGLTKVGDYERGSTGGLFKVAKVERVKTDRSESARRVHGAGPPPESALRSFFSRDIFGLGLPAPAGKAAHTRAGLLERVRSRVESQRQTGGEFGD